MRKLITALFVLLSLMSCILYTTKGFATTTFVVSSDTITGDADKSSRYSQMMSRQIVLIATDDTADSDPSLTLNSDTSGLSHPLEGWWLYQVWIDGNHAGTEPTEDSDLTIKEEGYDILGGGGTDIVDNTAERRITPTSIPFVTDLILEITNNIDNGAITYIKLTLYGEKLR